MKVASKITKLTSPKTFNLAKYSYCGELLSVYSFCATSNVSLHVIGTIWNTLAQIATLYSH